MPLSPSPLTELDRRRVGPVPPGIRLRHGAAQPRGRLPPRAALVDAPDQVPAAEEGLRRLQARHGGHAQAVPRQHARGVPERIGQRPATGRRRGTRATSCTPARRRLAARSRRRAATSRLRRTGGISRTSGTGPSRRRLRRRIKSSGPWCIVRGVYDLPLAPYIR